jgi:CheY-like chemotaxis protein
MSKEPVSLAEVLLECQGMMEPLAQQRSITLALPVFDSPAYVVADRTRVKQVLINLLSNAVKYNVRGGRIVVSCAERASGRIRTSIADTGPGLSASKLAQLFQPFNRLGQEGGGEEGTGIGLVVAKRLVELMGGSIGVESTPGEGTLFWFELASASEPHLAVESVEPIRTPDAASPKARNHTLLYVEDNPANRRLVEKIVARHPDMVLTTAANGELGIALARAEQPDVILMDINLPGISGVRALEILRADPLTAHIPVIAVSANAMPLDIEMGLKAGFMSYITKPIKVSEFMVSLDAALALSDANLAHRPVLQTAASGASGSTGPT